MTDLRIYSPRYGFLTHLMYRTTGGLWHGLCRRISCTEADTEPFNPDRDYISCRWCSAGLIRRQRKAAS